MVKEVQKLETAVFAAGCFWGVEESLRKVKGVKNTQVGYAGGLYLNPTYEDVCGGGSGHAEAVEVQYDPSEVSYSELLEVFWSIHDPTTPNRQGPDVGSQYRSVVFYHNAEQEKLARKSKMDLEHSGKFKNPVVTEITPASTFWRAEEYHQRYVEKGARAVC